MEVKEVVEGWKKGELSGEAAMFVIHDILYPAKITKEDIQWAKEDWDYDCGYPSCRAKTKQVNDSYCRFHQKILDKREQELKLTRPKKFNRAYRTKEDA
jgi:hypothetical protein